MQPLGTPEECFFKKSLESQRGKVIWAKLAEDLLENKQRVFVWQFLAVRFYRTESSLTSGKQISPRAPGTGQLKQSMIKGKKTVSSWNSLHL